MRTARSQLKIQALPKRLRKQLTGRDAPLPALVVKHFARAAVQVYAHVVEHVRPVAHKRGHVRLLVLRP
jgi:hypothetical protein